MKNNAKLIPGKLYKFKHKYYKNAVALTQTIDVITNGYKAINVAKPAMFVKSYSNNCIVILYDGRLYDMHIDLNTYSMIDDEGTND